jgi:hypothetical protein
MRSQSSRILGSPGASPFDVGAPPVPFVVSDNPFAPAPAVSFKERVPSPPIAPTVADQPQPDGPAQPAPDKIRVLSGRLVVPNGAGVTALAPDLSTAAPNDWPPPSADRRPVPEYPVPPPPSVYGLPDRDADSMDAWFNRWIKPLFEP